jgi:DNA-binding XRE family transcriptional regulator/beta-glucosidase/6-phospho-beta-glucosidase/beta-galactosidase
MKEEKEKERERFTIRRPHDKAKWICVDEKTGVSCKFATDDFASAKFTVPVWINEGKAETVKKKMTDFLFKNYYSIVYKNHENKEQFTVKQSNAFKWICRDVLTGAFCKFATGCFASAKFTIPVWMNEDNIKKKMADFLLKNYYSIAYKDEEERFTIKQPSVAQWVCVDERTGVSCKFSTGEFASAKFTIPEETVEVENIKKQMEAFLYKNHYHITYNNVFARRMRFCEEMQRIRLMRGLTQKQVAEAAEIATNYFQQIETGNATPSLDIFIKIAEIIGMQIDLKAHKRVEQYPENKALLSEIDTE